MFIKNLLCSALVLSSGSCDILLLSFSLMLFAGPQEGVVITLDGAQAAFISSDKLVFSLKGGEM